MRADLFPRSRLAGSQLDVAGYQFVASCEEEKNGNFEVRIGGKLFFKLNISFVLINFPSACIYPLRLTAQTVHVVVG